LSDSTAPGHANESGIITHGCVNGGSPQAYAVIRRVTDDVWTEVVSEDTGTHSGRRDD